MNQTYYTKDDAKQIEKSDNSKKAVRLSYGPHKGKYVLLDKKYIVDTRYPQ